ncbi:MAG: tRNA dihydrouridine(20/20a) synthase DusA [Pseudomonadales bacterium]|nr:tRNA dihydrouridine(20/20a) synthase DusA [Pseudomonadales bacterium]
MVSDFSHRFCVAPMLDCTDRHERYFLRLISKHARLYTEMINCGALIHGDRAGFLRYDNSEHPLALQLGGSDPAQLSQCTRFAEEQGYDEVNLNVGCPSHRVQAGRFGACLMKEPEYVAEGIDAMRNTKNIEITVKCRIGVDDFDSYEWLCGFIETVSKAGCNTFIIHARKALLKGLSPKQNRSVPPLCYETVHKIKRDFPHLKIIINGGLNTLDQTQEQLQHTDGVMIGREAYSNPFMLAEVDHRLYGEEKPTLSRLNILESFYPYIEQHLGEGMKLSNISRHIVGLFQGQVGARRYRRYISENAFKPGAGIEVLQKAVTYVA